MRSAWLAGLLTITTLMMAFVAAKDVYGDEKEWHTIFDGKSLDGWEHIGPGKMVLKDDGMHTDGGMGLLWYTRKKFGDCVIRVVYKTSSRQANSGIFVRIADKPKDPWYAVHHGYEIQISDGGDEFHGTGAIYSLSKSTGRPARPAGEWNTMDITLRGKTVLVSLNGAQINEFESDSAEVPERKKDYEPERGPRPASGYIGLQNHNDVGNGGYVVFKEVSVRPLKKEDRPKR